jgi:putative NADPH-quinone reductase
MRWSMPTPTARQQRITTFAASRSPRFRFRSCGTQAEFETGELSAALAQPREDMHWAEHLVFLFPLWHGTIPALFKAFLEHIFRLGFAMKYKKECSPKRLLAGSARIVVTMGHAGDDVPLGIS